MSKELQQISKWIGLIAGVLAWVLGLIHIFRIDANLEVPKKFHDDTHAKDYWRHPLFTFIPDKFVDIWSPFVFGAMATMCHFKQFPCLRWMTKSFSRYGAFLVVMALFGNFGYNGGMGIICASVSLLAALISIATYFVDDGECSLDLSLGIKLRARNG